MVQSFLKTLAYLKAAARRDREYPWFNLQTRAERSSWEVVASGFATSSFSEDEELLMTNIVPGI